MTVETSPGAAEDFAGRLFGILNSGMLSLMMGIGHRTGLFDTMAVLPPSSSVEIAKAAGLNERYVREWLGAMTTGRIVDHDPVAMTFFLPHEHAASLTRAAGGGNLAVAAQWVGLLAQVEDQVVECFYRGGGVPYAAFPERLTALQAEASGAGLDPGLVDATLPLVPGLIERLQSGIDVADVGCGSGQHVNLMARTFPASRFVGMDFFDPALEAARAEANLLGLSNVSFVQRNVASLAGSERFDLVTTFDAVHDQARPDLVLAGIARSLRPGGTYLCVDARASSTLAENMDHPFAPFLYSASCLHCMTVSLAEGGMGLGAAWGEQLALQMLAGAGFASVEVAHVEGDWFNNYYIATT
ncbi:MAG: class I SAM-dependent methyltransferase [Acidimicrobiales bacterium]